MAVRVAENLDLDVARLLDELLDEHPVVAEARARLVAARRESLERILVVEGDPQPLAATAGRRLDHHRVADAARDLDSRLGRLDRGVVPRDRRHPGSRRELLRGDLVAHRRDRLVLRPDEDNALLLDPPREQLVLRQEAVSRMHRLRAARLAGRDDLVDRQVRVPARRRADQDRLVRQLDMQRIPIGLGVDGNRRDAHAARRLDDTAGDLAAIGDQDLLEHQCALTAGCSRACARGRRPSCSRAWRASGRCAGASRAAGSRRRRSRGRWR